MEISEITREDIVRMINHVILLFNQMAEKWKNLFLDKLNKNPLRHVIQQKRITKEHIYNFDKWEHYFAYHDNKNKHKIILIKKEDVLKILKNVKKAVINDMLTASNYKLN